MSISPSDAANEGTLLSRRDRACLALIEGRWRRAPGVSLRLSPGAAGVVERPGRTRFDLQWRPGESQFFGPLRCAWPRIPMADGSLQMVIVDHLGAACGPSLQLLLADAHRVLSDDGRLLVIDTNPWGWLGVRARWLGQGATPAAASIARVLLQLGLEDIESEHALRLPPCPRVMLEKYGDRLETWCTRMLAVPGSIYAVSGRKRSSNVIAIPLQRDRRPALIAAPEGMRRAS